MASAPDLTPSAPNADAVAAADPLKERFCEGMCALGRCMGLNDLKGCSACNAVYYCCKDHQLEHWKGEGHKMVCKGRK